MNHSMTAKQFARRMEESQTKFYRLAYCYVKNEHDALEILSEAAYRGFIHLKRLEKPEFFDTWMSRIIINCACDLLKKQNRYDFYEPDDSFPPGKRTSPWMTDSICIRRWTPFLRMKNP